MAFIHGKLTRVYVNGFDLTAFFKSAGVARSREVAESTVFGQQDKTYLAGLRDATLSLEGLFDGAVDAVDDVLRQAIGADPASVWLLYPPGDALGNRGYGLQAVETAYDVDSPLDDLVGVSVEAQSIVGLESVLSHHALGAETATQNGASINGLAATTNGGVGYLQVTAYSGFTNVVVKVQDSADNIAFADLVTFATVTGRTKQRVALTGTVRQYTRYTLTVSGVGSVTLAVGFGRK